MFVTVLSSDLTTYVQTIAVGGPARDEANGIAVDPSGSTVYLVGTTSSSSDFTTTNAAQPTFGGGGKNNNRLSDAFVGKITIVPYPQKMNIPGSGLSYVAQIFSCQIFGYIVNVAWALVPLEISWQRGKILIC